VPGATKFRANLLTTPADIPKLRLDPRIFGILDVHSAVRASAAGHSAAGAAMNLISALSMALTKRGGVDGAPRLAS